MDANVLTVGVRIRSQHCPERSPSVALGAEQTHSWEELAMGTVSPHMGRQWIHSGPANEGLRSCGVTQRAQMELLQALESSSGAVVVRDRVLVVSVEESSYSRRCVVLPVSSNPQSGRSVGPPADLRNPWHRQRLSQELQRCGCWNPGRGHAARLVCALRPGWSLLRGQRPQTSPLRPCLQVEG